MSKLEKAYAIIIGTNFYQEEPLPEAIKDATDIYNLLIDDNFCGYKKENVKLLLDKDAKLNDIVKALDYLVEVTDEDSSVLFFYSGHGKSLDKTGDSSLLPYDYDWKKEINNLSGKEFRKKIGQIKSKRKVILLDCCHSGGLFQGENKSVLSEEQKVNLANHTQQKTDTRLESLAQEIDDDQGAAIVTSCQGSQLSWAAEGDENSIFTKCLKEVLSGEHRPYYEDRYVNMNEVVDHIHHAVPMNAKFIKQDQTPYSNLQMSEDFVISYLPKNKWKNIRPSKYSTPIKKGLSKNQDENNIWRNEGSRLLLFVHGFSGEGDATFGKLPKLLKENPKMDGWAMKPIGYSAHTNPKFGKTIWASSYDIDRVWRYLKTSIENKFKEYDSIAIVAHSLGGLVAQKAILELNEDQRSRISHFIMFGPPNNGIEQNKNLELAHLSSNGSFISELRKSWNKTFKIKTPFITKVVYAIDDEFVSKNSCFKGFKKENWEVIDGKHLTMVKPKDEKNAAYELILSTLNSDLEFYNTYTNKEEINLALGNYNAVLKRLLPYYVGEITEAYDDEIRRIVFAYEGLGEKQKAFDFLEKLIDHVNDKNDFMGVMGGRYKRSYLKTASKKDAELAFHYYNEGLKLARKKRNHSQKYYHAINLAFLRIVINSDLKKMINYAKHALRAANKCDDQWKWATIAEANMYLGDLKNAKKYYIKASKDASIRGKISMHTNAHAGYSAMKKSDNLQDDFTEFLKAKLLS